MNDVYISREKAIDAIEREFEEESYAGITAREAIYSVNIVDVIPVIHAHWVINSDGYYPYCSNCKTEPENDKMTKFCAECGARMDEVSE